MMQMRKLGRLWPVSALALGGAGLGQLWGPTDREEAVATLREGVDAGINLIDVAPRYGNGEAERVVGEAFGGKLPSGVHISTKHHLGNPPAAEVIPRLERALAESLERMRLRFVDIYFLHSSIVPRDELGNERRTPRSLFAKTVRPAFEKLIADGLIGAWGITAVEMPSAILETLADEPSPAVAQCIANALDSPGEMKWSDEPARPREIISAARENGVGVMGIRAVQAGALTDRVDRDLPYDNPVMIDYRRAQPLRTIAREVGMSTAAFAHRYALSMDGVDTVVLGIKNRSELRDCLAAEAAGPLPLDIIAKIDSGQIAA
jgi:aryl-alcohol dehydrogenase-like predicted oxidoreductase